MCTEFFLACLYFVIIFTINFFFFRLLRIYFKNIIELQKIKNILKIYPNNEFFIKLYNYSTIEFRNSNTLLLLQKLDSEKIDNLVLGNIYRYLALKSNKNQKNNYINDYYFQLLANQYLSFNFNLK
jgi:hypothetical protein